jgi:hypothetical protein
MLLSFLALLMPASAELTVRADFEGGSVDVLEVDRETQRVRVRPGLGPRDTRRIWFYFEINGYTPGRDLVLEVAYHEFQVPTDGRTLSSLHPEIVVRDGGGEFRAVRGTPNAEKTFRVYRLQPESARVRVALGHPYVYSDMIAFVRGLEASPACTVDYPWTSEGGRPVPMVRIGGAEAGRPFVLIIGRQHAFEVAGSFFLEGVLQAAVESESPAMSGFREACTLEVVPMVDVDNAAEGGSGKAQKPMDFNRSWADDRPWNAVAGIREWFKQARRERPPLGFLDSHTPFPVEPFGHYYVHSSNTAPEVHARHGDRRSLRYHRCRSHASLATAWGSTPGGRDDPRLPPVTGPSESRQVWGPCPEVAWPDRSRG